MQVLLQPSAHDKCIQLVNQMRSRRPLVVRRSLRRDLMSLQRSRSFRDPSTTPYLCLSPSIVGKFAEIPRKTKCAAAAETGDVLKVRSRVESAEESICEDSNEKYGSSKFSANNLEARTKVGRKKRYDQQSISDISNRSILSNNPSLHEDFNCHEELPLLREPSWSPASTDSPFLPNDYSGELESNVTPNGSNSLFRCHGQHQSLIQKYTPGDFTDILGQNFVVKALSNAVLRRKVRLVYLFYGPHGTGKSSCANIFAKALNCQAVAPPRPCDGCTHCITYNLTKSLYVVTLGPLGNFDYDEIVDRFKSERLSSYYRVLIIEDCDTLNVDSWCNISKLIDQAPRHFVFILISSTNIESLPKLIVTRCQKFHFAKLRDSDIIHKLQCIAINEGFEVDKDAMKLIASRSDGSLSDAEMILEQLSLLGERVSLPLVQELVGFVSDEKLMDLLDLALSADTVNTIKLLRDIIEDGVDPLSLLSQLATIITDIIAGSYVFFNSEKPVPKFFGGANLQKKDMEKLRQVLQTLSKAEKQLMSSNDKLTSLTAALLQLAPDYECLMLNSMTLNTSCLSPCIFSNFILKDRPRNSINSQDAVDSERSILRRRVSNDALHNDELKNKEIDGRRRNKKQTSLGTLLSSAPSTKVPECYNHGKRHMDNEKIWEKVLEKIQPDTIKQFLYKEGKLISISLATDTTVYLNFSSHESKSIAEKCRGLILEAFESLLYSPVTLEIRCELNECGTRTVLSPHILNFKENVPYQTTMKRKSITKMQLKEDIEGNGSRAATEPLERGKDEIVEIVDSARKHEMAEHVISQYKAITTPQAENREVKEYPRRKGLFGSKVSLRCVIERAKGRVRRAGWFRGKPVSISEKLENENMRLKPMSRSQLCRTSGVPSKKLLNIRLRSRKPNCLAKKLARCGRCLI